MSASKEKGDPNQPFTLTEVESEFDASMIVTALAEQGIAAKTTGGFTAGFLAEAPGLVQVVVAKKDLKQAKDILKTFSKSKPEIDWSKVDVGDPEDE